MAKGVAYIRFVGFPDDPDAVAAAADFMKAHAGRQVARHRLPL